MAIPKVYRSTDSGAPVLATATAGSALAVIRACLVDGYGSEAPAGWTEEFTDAPNHTAVFRNSTASGGTGCYVRVDDREASLAYRAVVLNTYASMSDVNTGTVGTPNRYLYRRPANTNTNAAWTLVATDKAFFINIIGGYNGLAGAGDAVSFVAADAYRYFCAGSNSNNNPNITWIGANTGVNNNAADGLSFARDHTGIAGPVDYGSFARWSTAILGGAGWPVSPSPMGGEDIVMPFYLTRTDGIRGRLPGVIVPLFNATGAATGSTRSGLQGPGSEAVLIRAGVSNASVYIETALDWGD